MIAGLCNVKKELEDLERRSKTLERDKADAKRVGGYLAEAKKIKKILLASENLLDEILKAIKRKMKMI